MVGDAIGRIPAQISKRRSLALPTSRTSSLHCGKQKALPHKVYNFGIDRSTINSTSGRGNRNVDETCPNNRIEHHRILGVAEHIHIAAIVGIVIATIITPRPLPRRESILSKQSNFSLSIVIMLKKQKLFCDSVFVEFDEISGGQRADFLAHCYNLLYYVFLVRK